MSCEACGSNSVLTEKHLCKKPPTQGRSFNFIICKDCGFIYSPDNRTAYVNNRVLNTAPEPGGRAGNGIVPGREFRIAEMAVRILASSGVTMPSVCVVGAGPSRDHQLIAKVLPVGDVAITDVFNFQNADNFILLENTKRRFDLLIASEVIEHFTQPRKDFRAFFQRLSRNGMAIASTTMQGAAPIGEQSYPFLPGHAAFYSGRALLAIAKGLGYEVDFRAPAAAFHSPGPNKRYIFFYRSKRQGREIASYFAETLLAPSEHSGGQYMASEASAP